MSYTFGMFGAYISARQFSAEQLTPEQMSPEHLSAEQLSAEQLSAEQMSRSICRGAFVAFFGAIVGGAYIAGAYVVSPWICEIADLWTSITSFKEHPVYWARLAAARRTNIQRRNSIITDTQIVPLSLSVRTALGCANSNVSKLVYSTQS